MPIVITETEGLRLLQFGTHWCQGAMRIDTPDELVLAYAARMSAWLLFHPHESLSHGHLVTLGLGAGSLTRFAHRVLGMRATAVEIDVEVIDACRAHFMLPPDSERLRVVHADASAFIAQKDVANSIDVLQVDAYDADVDRPVLDTDRFYASCRNALRPDATVAVNLIGQAMDVRETVQRIRRNLRPQAVWQFPPIEAGNVVVLAHCGDMPDEAVLVQRAEAIERRFGWPAREWLAMVRRTTIAA